MNDPWVHRRTVPKPSICLDEAVSVRAVVSGTGISMRGPGIACALRSTSFAIDMLDTSHICCVYISVVAEVHAMIVRMHSPNSPFNLSTSA